MISLDRHVAQLIEQICGTPYQFSIRQQIVNWTTFFCFLISLFFVLINSLLATDLIWALCGALGCLIAYFFARFQSNLSKLMAPLLVILYFTLSTGAWFSHAGIDGVIPRFAVVVLLVAIIIFQKLVRTLTILGIALQIGLLTYIQMKSPSIVMMYPDEMTHQFHLLSAYCCIALFCIGLMAVLVHNLDVRHQQANTMLYNILPDSVADSLIAHPERNVTHYFERVSILFADIVNFTPMSTEMTSVELVSLLNELFSDFDTLIATYNVEKIKTIGDCYVIAAGTPRPMQNHAQILAQIALEMQQLVQQKRYLGRQLELHIAIHSGSVVAGVIGKNKFIYDLWGETVNTISLMDSHGKRGMIQITRATYDLINTQFFCVAQGTIERKGQQPVEVWQLLGERPMPLHQNVQLPAIKEPLLSGAPPLSL